MHDLPGESGTIVIDGESLCVYYPKGYIELIQYLVFSFYPEAEDDPDEIYEQLDVETDAVVDEVRSILAEPACVEIEECQWELRTRPDYRLALWEFPEALLSIQASDDWGTGTAPWTVAMALETHPSR
jgi:hypothetical protein